MTAQIVNHFTREPRDERALASAVRLLCDGDGKGFKWSGRHWGVPERDGQLWKRLREQSK